MVEPTEWFARLTSTDGVRMEKKNQMLAEMPPTPKKKKKRALTAPVCVKVAGPFNEI